MSTPALVILDRDGVINRDSPDFVKSADEWIPIEGSIEAIAELTKSGIKVAVATNQSGIGRGLFTEAALNDMHDKLTRLVTEAGGSIEAIHYCPHLPRDGCDCRKPAPGLLLQVASRLNISLDGVPVVGDSLRDLEAAQAVGALPVLVRTGKGVETEAGLSSAFSSIPVFDDLQAFVKGLSTLPVIDDSRAFVDELAGTQDC